VKSRAMSNKEYEREFQRKFGAPRRLTKHDARQIARDLQRLQSLESKVNQMPLHRDTLETLKWARQYNERRLGKLRPDDLAKVVCALKRPYRTDLQNQFAKVHDALCRENDGQLPTYGAIKQKLEANGLRHSLRNLRRMNKATLHLPMPGRGRPKSGQKKLAR